MADEIREAKESLSQNVEVQDKFKMTWRRWASEEQLGMLHNCSSTDYHPHQAASSPVLLNLESRSRSIVSLYELEMFLRSAVEGIYTAFAGFDHVGREVLR